MAFDIEVAKQTAVGRSPDALEEIWALAEARGFNKSDLARILGVAQSTVSRWYSRQREPQPCEFAALAKLLDFLRGLD